jgi:VWFA-related protein
MFFSVSSHGRMVNDLQQSDIRVLDDNKPPERVVQFASQSKLPLRLALLVDTSGSVHNRFSFEKHAAVKFVEKMLSGDSDLAFIAGFSNDTTVTQDFSREPADLGNGINKLTNGEEQRCLTRFQPPAENWPRIRKRSRSGVLVILSDGEDNSAIAASSRASGRRGTGVTIYTVVPARMQAKGRMPTGS